ncbi:aminotransferase class I/II-fold pyridoxal phosphate-dependent enzyme [Bacillus sp. FJAT-27251]|uniref:aminotransferase class I/II-fold pyridoxal phosphate-dependent enzyme n=1 Tax=Bacillus sp. FJAT-27251 TaxID=1684142 RepID=UPI0006A78877|nr:aminotransferase class I/II-fold pyridoxal phosphate-dependent enzyme [Bacillus sp. FJAT-27251]
MDQRYSPLLDQLLLHRSKKPISFHVPGHKYGEVLPEKMVEHFRSLLRLDATELTGLDDLHSPEGVILEAEKLLAGLYQARKSFFLVGGSTSGNIAMIMAALNEDDVVLVQRNSHKSVMNGIRLARAKPVFLSPEWDSDSLAAGGVSLKTVREAIQSYPEAKALLLTYPNYYGMVYNLKDIIDLAHEHHIPVLVDEAHGVHFIAGEPFPPSALSLGADVVVQSAHKTLPAMTMGAYLHYNSTYIPLSKLAGYLQMIQSSSPSYPIMASLDASRSYLGTFGREDIQFLMDGITAFREDAGKIDRLEVLPSGDSDPLKMIVRSPGCSGFQLQKVLEEQGIYAEMADPYNVLLVLPLLKAGMPGPYKEAIEKLTAAATQVGTIMPATLPVKQNNTPVIGTLAVGYREMENRNETFVPLAQSAGSICAETLIPYPPGIPLLMPGEVITEAALEELHDLLAQSAKIQGGERIEHRQIKIFIPH